MTPTQHLALLSVVRDVIAERHRQHEKWGEQDLKFGTPALDHLVGRVLDLSRRFQGIPGSPTWNEVLLEEACEVHFAGTDEEREAELLQVAAVAVQAVECIRRRRAARQVLGLLLCAHCGSTGHGFADCEIGRSA